MTELEKLCKIPCLSGFENQSTDEFKKIFSEFGFDDVKSDENGNIYAEKKAKKANINILIDAHIDEIGLIVKSVEENGFLKFDTIGGINPQTLYCREVIIYGKKEIYGVIGALPPHLRRENQKEELYIDTGIKDIAKYVNAGDPVKFKTNFTQLKNSEVSSGCLDNRAGLLCALMSGSKMRDDINVTVLGSIREETGTHKFEKFLKDKKFDLAIIIDVTHGYFEGLSPYSSYRCSQGFTICYGGVLDNKITSNVENYLIKNDIKYNVEFEPDNPGTNAYNIMINNVPAIMLSIPLKYMHTTCETLSLKDIESLSDFISSANWKKLLKKEEN